MKLGLTFFLCIWSFSHVLAQNRAATFPGGTASLYSFLESNLHYPESAPIIDQDTVFKVMLKIDQYGKAQVDFFLQKIDNLGYSNEIKRVVDRMPNWQPELVDGRAISSQSMITIRFKMERKMIKVDYEKFGDYYLKVDQPASYPGGQQALKQSLAHFFRDQRHIEHTRSEALIRMVVDREGDLRQVQILDSKGNMSKEYWIAAIYASGSWKPAKVKGAAVSSQHIHRVFVGY